MYDEGIMKLTSALFLSLLTAPLAAQTPAARPAPAKTGTSTPRATAVAACVKEPEFSPKIPALATGACAKHLYTITTIPSVRVENISPFEPATLKADLGIEASTFSLDYIDTKIGTGQLAGAHSWYTINYTGYMTDGSKFDSSIDRGEPITIPYGQHHVIEGWDTGFAGMRVGGKRRLIIPYQLAYGTQGKAPIPPKAMLIFDVELVEISETEPKPKTPPTPPAPKPGMVPQGSQPGTQPAPVAPPPGSPTKPTPSPANPANPATVPPPTDPTKPAAVPPPTTSKP